ncbi:alpha/beta hydrolase [Paenibacillus sp. CC-CFT747]|nr:alpha/beta hydrolase [Paenibacillus sp. CC-CFT747]
MNTSLRHKWVRVSDIDLHVVESGPENGPLIILLHGFPEFWYGWHKQIPELAEQGFRIWAPDMRGYAASGKDEHYRSSTLPQLAGDILGLMDAEGVKRAVWVGHDFGAAVTWYASWSFPERVRKAVILNVPHPAVMYSQVVRKPSQMLRSSYMLFFQLPGLPEWVLRRNRFRVLERALQKTSRPGTFGDGELARYREAWKEPGALKGMLNAYRALRLQEGRPRIGRIYLPVLIIWGAKDAFLSRSLVRPSLEMCENGTLVMIEEATHWIHHEEPMIVTRKIADFARD